MASTVERGVPEIVRRTEANSLSFVEPPQWVNELKENRWLPEKIVIADPLSYCAGVERSIKIADALFEEANGEPVYLYHAPIHNETKLREWEEKGGIIVNDLNEVPPFSTVLFSAHGVSPEIWKIAREKQLKGADATCPLVEKPHRDVQRLTREGYDIIAIGHRNHDEIQGLVGIAPNKITVLHPATPYKEVGTLVTHMGEKFGLRTQTTLAHNEIVDLIEYIKKQRPDVDLPRSIDDICFATQNRQDAIINAIVNAGVEEMIIFGSDENSRTPSSNTIRQREVAQGHGASAHIVENIGTIKSEWFRNIKALGIAAGASADPKRVSEFLKAIKNSGIRSEQIFRATVAEERMVFAEARRFDFSAA